MSDEFIFSLKRFRGGLDIKNNNTGNYSIYEKYNTAEIMFHVSTLLPHSVKDEQQLERKRHIGGQVLSKNIFILPHFKYRK